MSSFLPIPAVCRTARAWLGSSAPAFFVLFALMVGSALVSQTAFAQQRSGVALSVQASTMGPSASVHIRAMETLRIRIRGSYLPYSFNEPLDDDDVEASAKGDARLGGPELRVDWHPFKSGFHLSGGALYNMTEVDALIFPTAPYKYSDRKTFSVDRIGTVNATASYPAIAPYAGIGVGDALSGRWGFLVELGTYFTGSPEFDFSGNGLIKPTERNEVILEEGFESFQFFPHLALGLSYQF